MKKLSSIFSLLGILFLAGCMTPPQENCDKYGFKKGTDAYASCLQKEEQMRQNRINNIWSK
jgi:PBP1b-binding outer membrane lipoprotein LpoB